MVGMVRSTVLAAPVEAVSEVLRDFNGHDRRHPIVKDSVIGREWPPDRMGCVQRFHLEDGAELREQLLWRSATPTWPSDAACATRRSRCWTTPPTSGWRR